jgi:SulP family sulfate permease
VKVALAPFRPRLILALRGYNRAALVRDVTSGMTVGFVALPLAMAFGIASGVKPEQGLVTGIVAGFLISLLGGSRVQIGGPAGAFVALLYGIVDRYGVANLLIATMMAGVFLFAMGALRMGMLIRFVPVSIIIGFTNGIAVLIALQQVRDLIGLPIDRMPANFFSQIKIIGETLPSLNLWAVIVALTSLLVLILWPRWTSGKQFVGKVPASVIALILGTLAVVVFDLPVDTIGSRFGGIPAQLPLPALPTPDWESARQLVAPALSIALLGAIESLLCARVADGMIDDRHDPNQELMAQGIANLVSPLFGGIAATGTIARTVTNVRAGGRTPIAGIVHALTLAAIVLLAAPLASNVPLSTLGAILLMVAWNMGEWRAFEELKRFHLPYRTTLLSTFLLTVVFDITVAVEVGLILSCLFFIWRISTLTRVESVALPNQSAATGAAQGSRTAGLWRIEGALFFGSIDKLEVLLDPTEPLPKLVLLDLTRLLYLDATGQEALDNLRRSIQRAEGQLVVIAASGAPLDLMKRSGFLDRLGPSGQATTIDQAFSARPGNSDQHRL